ncbi:MAG TPA: hypothetical protein VFA65_02000, partial [Bryobacteraceae bacterium]|nr:hypothetical protein [Bryobacteraceae bacterium]
EAQQYLKDERVQLDEIKQIPLDRIDVTGTPTMLLVNSRGIVVQTWLGKLEPDKQEQALKVMLSNRSRGSNAKTDAASAARS